MTKYIAALIGLLLVSPAMAQTGTVKTAAQLNAEINTNIASAQSGGITALELRQVLLDMVASPLFGPIITAPPQLTFQTLSGGSHDISNFYIQRIANYTGGTFGFVNFAFKAETTVSAGTTSFEWTGLFKMNNNGTQADASQNVALYAQSYKLSTGPTWASTFELIETPGANPITGTVTTEFDLEAIGSDNNSARYIQDLWLKLVPGSSGSTANPTAAAGIRMNTDSSVGTGTTTITRGFYCHGVITICLYSDASVPAGTFIQDTGSRTWGMDFSGATFSSGAAHFKTNMPIVWDTNSTFATFYSGTSFSFRKGSGTVLQIDDSGNIGVGTFPSINGLDVVVAGAAQLRANDSTDTVDTRLISQPGTGIVGTKSNTDFVTITNNVERIRVTNAGLVGIGGTPAVNLDVIVAGASQIRAKDTTDTVETRMLALAGAGIIGTYSNSLLAVYVNAAEVARFPTTGGMRITSGTLSSMGTCNASAAGTIGYITDSNTTTWGATIAGGSSSKVLAFCDATNWTVAGS